MNDINNHLIINYRSSCLTVKEVQIMLACIGRNMTVEDDSFFHIYVNELKELFYNSNNINNAYRDTRRATEGLYNKGFLMCAVSDEMLDNGEVELYFQDEVLTYLKCLEVELNDIQLKELCKLSNIHSIRLYELMVMWVNRHQYSKKIQLDEFRYIMGIKGKYKQFAQLRERLIEIAVEEINTNTDYTVSVAYHKTRRQFTSLTLNFAYLPKIKQGA